MLAPYFNRHLCHFQSFVSSTKATKNNSVVMVKSGGGVLRAGNDRHRLCLPVAVFLFWYQHLGFHLGNSLAAVQKFQVGQIPPPAMVGKVEDTRPRAGSSVYPDTYLPVYCHSNRFRDSHLTPTDSVSVIHRLFSRATGRK